MQKLQVVVLMYNLTRLDGVVQSSISLYLSLHRFDLVVTAGANKIIISHNCTAQTLPIHSQITTCRSGSGKPLEQNDSLKTKYLN